MSQVRVTAITMTARVPVEICVSRVAGMGPEPLPKRSETDNSVTTVARAVTRRAADRVQFPQEKGTL